MLAEWREEETRKAAEARHKRAEELTRKIAYFAQRKQLGKSIETFEQLKAERLRPSAYTYSNMINAHINSGDVVGGQRMFGAMLDAGFRPNVVL